MLSSYKNAVVFYANLARREQEIELEKENELENVREKAEEKREEMKKTQLYFRTLLNFFKAHHNL